MGDDLALIQNDQTQYCVKQVNKMCFYVQKLYHTEILRMKCLFVRDYNGTIWFQHAQDIFVRVNQFAKMAYEQQVQDMADLQLKNKQKVLRQRIKENIIKKQKVGNLKMMMGKHFDQMKDRAGLLELEEDSGEDKETTDAFQKLRPGVKSDLGTHLKSKKHNLKITSRILNKDGP